VLAVRREGHAEDPVGVVLDRLFEPGVLPAVAQVPHVYDAVAAAGGELLAVGAEGEAEDLVVGVEELLEHHGRVVDAVEDRHAVLDARRAAVDVVNADVAFLARPAAGHGQLAVREEDQRGRPPGAGVNPFLQLRGVHVPDGQFVVAADDEAFAVGGERQRGDRGREDVGGGRRRRLPAQAEFALQVRLGRQSRVEFGPFGDPAPDNRDLFGRQRVAGVLRRHARLVSRREDVDDVALVGLTGDDRVVLGAALAERFVAGHVELALGVFGPVAAQARLLEDGCDLVDEADRLLVVRPRRRSGRRK
jgi:hypothetical protein